MAAVKESRYILLPHEEYERLTTTLDKVERYMKRADEVMPPFPRSGPVCKKQILAFIGVKDTKWYEVAKENDIKPIPGFESPKMWQAEKIWELCGYANQEGFR